MVARLLPPHPWTLSKVAPMYLPPDPTEVHPAGFIRRRCRNPRCGAKLKCETDRADAFCGTGALNNSTKTSASSASGQCDQKGPTPAPVLPQALPVQRFHRHPEQFLSRFTPPSRGILTRDEMALTSAHSTGLKTDTKPDRPWHVVAGPSPVWTLPISPFPSTSKPPPATVAQIIVTGPKLHNSVLRLAHRLNRWRRFSGARARRQRPPHQQKEPKP